MSFAQEVEAAYGRIAEYIRDVPLIRSEYFSEKLGCNLYFKLDNIQMTGSFKVRGALNKASTLTQDQIDKGFVTASGGNHGLGVCYAANVYGTSAIIYVPVNTPEFKIKKIKGMGAEIRLHGNSICEAAYEAIDFAKENEKTYIHGYNDEEVIRGQGTLGFEILRDLPETDVIIASVGGGGLLAGIATYMKEVKPDIRAYGSQTIGADAMFYSLEAGENIKLDKITSCAESLAIQQVARRTMKYIQDNAETVLRVSDDEAMRDACDILQYEKQLVEPAASCSLAILTTGQVPNIKGKNVVVVLCGSNIPVERFLPYIKAS